jgi:hypothetical protein
MKPNAREKSTPVSPADERDAKPKKAVATERRKRMSVAIIDVKMNEILSKLLSRLTIEENTIAENPSKVPSKVIRLESMTLASIALISEGRVVART